MVIYNCTKLNFFILAVLSIIFPYFRDGLDGGPIEPNVKYFSELTLFSTPTFLAGPHEEVHLQSNSAFTINRIQLQSTVVTMKFKDFLKWLLFGIKVVVGVIGVILGTPLPAVGAAVTGDLSVSTLQFDYALSYT